MSKEINTVQQSDLLELIQRPHISEKATIVGEKYNQFVFKVAPEATKTQIKKVIEMLFNVNVEQVRVLNVKKKAKRFKQMSGFRKGWKKAYVSLKKGQDINFMEAN